MKRNLFIVLQALGGALVLFIVASWVSARIFIGSHHCAIGATPAGFPYAVESVSFRTSDSLELRGWYCPASRTGAPSVILLHGYTSNRTDMLGKARMLHDAGYATLMYDARGCGESDGEKISMGYFETADLKAAVAYLRGREIGEIGAIGVSQGGATIAMAGNHLAGIRCAILESTYDDMDHAIDRRFRHYLGIPGWLGASMLVPFAEGRLGCCVHGISPVARIARLGCPVMIISGEEDTRVPVEDTRRLFEAAAEPKSLWLIPHADHEDLQRVVPAEYDRRVLAFLGRYMPVR
jgi:pimeloyl-ACP methyl ester carboxylesterase